MSLKETKILKTISVILGVLGTLAIGKDPQASFILYSVAIIAYAIAKKYEKPASLKNPTFDENLLKQKEQELRIRELELKIQKMEGQSARK